MAPKKPKQKDVPVDKMLVHYCPDCEDEPIIGVGGINASHRAEDGERHQAKSIIVKRDKNDQIPGESGDDWFKRLHKQVSSKFE